MAEAILNLGTRMTCDSSVLIGDWVYIRPDGVADLADASDVAKMPAVGFVAHKQGVTLAFVKTDGIFKRSPQTFTPGAEVFISATQPGRVVQGPPGGAAVIQKAGDGHPDGVSIIVNIDLKGTINIAAGGEVIRTYALGVSLRDVVYTRSDGVIDRASATSETTIQGLGIVSALDDPSLGLAKMQYAGDLSGFSGLTVGALYIAGTGLGTIVREDDTGNANYPNVTSGSGHVIAEVGVAASPTTLFVGTQRDFQEI